MPTLNWLTRDDDLTAAERVPYRLLEEVPELSYTEKDPATENMLIQGDNLEALKALLPFYAGKVKCIFIDPPYNTKSAFGNFYDDNLEHSQWLAMMYPRLELLREFLREDGSIWVTIDDNEAHYLKVIMDEVFGRGNFISNVTWVKRTSPANDAKYFSSDCDTVLVYAKSKPTWRPRKLPRTAAQDAYYKNPDDDPRGSWNSVTYTGNKTRAERPNLYYPILHPSTGSEIYPPKTLTWRYSPDRHAENVNSGLLWWGADSKSKTPRLKSFLSDAGELVPRSIWLSAEVGSTQSSMTEQKALFESPFLTPKPESLLERVIRVATDDSDLVLDSFLGSATTTAVAQKMGRRYIGIEMGEHAVTHCVPRMKKVVDGEQGGISKLISHQPSAISHQPSAISHQPSAISHQPSIGWQGGGGFRFYRLGKTVFDEDGQINPEIRFPALAAHIWFIETRTPLGRVKKTPKLGVHEGTAYYLLYNGVLGDKRPDGGNVLTRKVLAELAPHDGPRVIYGESSRLGAETLKSLGIVFKQTPYDVRAR